MSQGAFLLRIPSPLWGKVAIYAIPTELLSGQAMRILTHAPLAPLRLRRRWQRIDGGEASGYVRMLPITTLYISPENLQNCRNWEDVAAERLFLWRWGLPDRESEEQGGKGIANWINGQVEAMLQLGRIKSHGLPDNPLPDIDANRTARKRPTTTKTT